jgi:phospholipid transport system substrate-binding protein
MSWQDKAAAPRRAIRGLLLALLLTTAAVPGYANVAGASPTDTVVAGASPTDTVRGFYATLLTTMQNAPALGDRGRYATLKPVIEEAFDLPYMTRLAVGSSWATLTAAKQQQVTEAFGRYVAATYADRFDGYSGEKLQVTGEQPNAGGTIVQSRIVRSDGDPVIINYMMRRNGDAWRIADVYLTGTISQIATERSQFSSILRSQGIDGLIAMLNHKANLLVASAAGP